ncbi:MAG TPA: TorF family putative porin, partial [Terricaulis sp.]|nr:TorF family putative porin [Terricaulis sp.]
MKKLIGVAVAAGAAFGATGAAHAQTVSASVTLTSDYVFRGMSLSGEDAAVQGSFDYSTDLFYAGVWGSSLGSGGTSMELDVYAGFTPTLGPVALDIGVV